MRIPATVIATPTCEKNVLHNCNVASEVFNTSLTREACAISSKIFVPKSKRYIYTK